MKLEMDIPAWANITIFWLLLFTGMWRWAILQGFLIWYFWDHMEW